MNLPNYLTFSRIIISFFCIWLTLKGSLSSLILAFLFFLIASFTDFLDGFLARRREKVSDLGRLLDPIADKILILGMFLAFLVMGIINVWVVIIIMLREFLITGIRFMGLSRGYVMEAKRFGKHKTVSQILGINFIFITLISNKLFPHSYIVKNFLTVGIPVVMWYIVAITAFSGIHYVWANRKIIRTF